MVSYTDLFQWYPLALNVYPWNTGKNHDVKTLWHIFGILIVAIIGLVYEITKK